MLLGYYNSSTAYAEESYLVDDICSILSERKRVTRTRGGEERMAEQRMEIGDVDGTDNSANSETHYCLTHNGQRSVYPGCCSPSSSPLCWFLGVYGF